MKFSIDVGEVKKHRIEYDFNQWLGRVVIKLNHQVVKHRVRLLREPVKESDQIDIGDGERLAVRIEKRRCRFLHRQYSIFLNGRLFQSYQGS